MYLPEAELLKQMEMVKPENWHLLGEDILLNLMLCTVDAAMTQPVSCQDRGKTGVSLTEDEVLLIDQTESHYSIKWKSSSVRKPWSCQPKTLSQQSPSLHPQSQRFTKHRPFLLVKPGDDWLAFPGDPPQLISACQVARSDPPDPRRGERVPFEVISGQLRDCDASNISGHGAQDAWICLDCRLYLLVCVRIIVIRHNSLAPTIRQPTVDRTLRGTQDAGPGVPCCLALLRHHYAGPRSASTVPRRSLPLLLPNGLRPLRQTSLAPLSPTVPFAAVVLLL